MATLSTKLTVTSSDARTDNLSLTLSDTLVISDPIETGKRNVTTAVAGGGEFIPAADSNTYYIYLKNLDSTNYAKIQDAGANIFGRLHPGEFIWFTLAPSEGLEMQADTATVQIEYGIFKKA